jgi:dihydrofolate reductase
MDPYGSAGTGKKGYMSELIADLFISVDGCARGSRSPAYFGFGGPDLDRWIREQMQRPQRHLMGRKTYEALAALPEPVSDEGGLSLAATPTTVFSRTLRAVAWPQATVAGDLAGTVRRLKAEDSDLRIIGSLSLVRQLLGAGLIDRLRLLVFPLIAGETGQEPAFAQMPDVGLDLVGQSVLDRRIVLCEYRPSGLPPYAS